MSIKRVKSNELGRFIGRREYGYYGKYGAYIGEASWVIIEGKGGTFLAPREMFREIGFNIAPTTTLVNAIGGLDDVD